jgi:hypothetical protein
MIKIACRLRGEDLPRKLDPAVEVPLRMAL